MCPNCIICGDEYDDSTLTTHTRRRICPKGQCFNVVEALIHAAYPLDIWWMIERSTRLYKLPWNKIVEISDKVKERCARNR